MQRNNVPISPTGDTLKNFRAAGRMIVRKREPDLSLPSTSAANKEENEPTSQMLSPRIAFNLRLIELIKPRRCLYDGTTPGGRSSALKLQMWDGLARQLEYGQGGFQLQKRWKQIRDKYVKERRMSSERDPEGEVPEGTPEEGPPRASSAWPLFSKLSFLEPFLVERDPDRSMSPAPSSFFERSATRPRGAMSPSEVEDFNRRVIDSVRGRPVLYSRAEPHYHSFERRKQAWHAVLSELGFLCDLGEIQRYWKGLRDRYIRIRRSLKSAQDTCDPSSDCSYPSLSGKRDATRWVHYQDLTWMEPFLEFQQRERERHALARQAAERSRRGLVALADEDDGVEVDYEVDREEVQENLLELDPHTQLLEAGVRFDGDTAYAASVISDIRALPLELQAHVRARITLALEHAPSASEAMERMEKMERGEGKERKERRKGGEEEGMEVEPLVLEDLIGEVTREEVVEDTLLETD